MLSETQNDLYFSRMAASLGDKTTIVEYLKNGNVLDVGAGGGDFSNALQTLGYKTIALDGSPTAIEKINTNYPHIPTVLSSVHNAINEFPVNSFNNIVCSSILHEVFSYPDNNYSEITAVDNVIHDFYQLLEPNGHLIIRDGVIPENWDNTVNIEFINDNYNDGMSFVDYYKENCPFYGDYLNKRSVHLDKIGDNILQGNYSSIMEFLYTYTWGWNSAPRESQEIYGIMTMSDYHDFLNTHGFTIAYSNSYLQQGYYDNLKDKVRIFDNEDNNIAFPDSNMIIVAKKI